MEQECILGAHDNSVSMVAHVDCKTRRIQTLREHSINVSELCGQLAYNLHMKALPTLCGLLHDMGKGTQQFQSYLLISAGIKPGSVQRGSVHHAPIGAIYVYRRWYDPNRELASRTSAQLLMMAIYGHHTGLMDVVTYGGVIQLLERMQQNTDILDYEEAVHYFEEQICSASRLDSLFDTSVEEVKGFLSQLKSAGIKDKAFIRGVLAKELLGILVDADRWDSACFEYATDSKEKRSLPDWENALQRLNDHLAGMDQSGEINRIRSKVSSDCEAAASGNNHLYRLSVPTGGGKTFASLRFALKYAQSHTPNVNRVFYIIPFNTILDQNAKDIREVLGNSLRILEHHSNVVFTGDDADEEYANYRLLTERWDSDLILTSMVQFLNCFYRANNSDVRRLPHLSGSVLVFDEIQSLPKKCTHLFEQAIDFLTEFCDCTVVLCTATQPALQFHRDPVELVSNVESLFQKLKRTRIIDQTKISLSYLEASERAEEMVRQYGAVLMIVNTKEAAREIATQMGARGVPTVHLSTDMVPAHRIQIIEAIKNRGRTKPLFCVSTALIEAGINISFPCVIRSLAGLGSILQAAGRCNRNGELGSGKLGDVYVWSLNEEKLGNLQEISQAQQLTYGVFKSHYEADSPEGIAQYYQNERNEFRKLAEYPVYELNATLLDLLGKNTTFRKEISEKYNSTYFPIPGAFQTAGEKFQVVDSQTKSVLVPYEEGQEIITRLCASRDMKELTHLLREAQQYCVSLYENRFNSFFSEDKIQYNENFGVYILRKEYYSQETGVTDTPSRKEILYF